MTHMPHRKVRGSDLFYVAQGTGPPLLLLHGGQRDPDSWSAEMYDAVGIIFEGVKSSRTVSAKAGAEYTRQLTAAKPYRGLMGDVYFDGNGDPLYSLYKIKIVDGVKKILGR